MQKTLSIGVAALFCAAAFGQAPAGPAFEVVSINPAPPLIPELAHSGKLHLGTKIDAARADFGGVSLLDFIARAYGVRTFQIAGPDWMQSTRFDIVAKLPEGSSVDQVPQMLQALLVQRFGLKLRTESRDFPVYALVVTKNGAKMTARSANYEAPANNSERLMTMPDYAELVSYSVDKPVVDLTGLKGEYVMATSFLMPAMIDKMRAVAKSAGVATSSAPTGAAMSGPAEASGDAGVSPAFGAVETLGLKLEPRKLPMPYLIVEHLDKTAKEQ